jgi:hypothetical protein
MARFKVPPKGGGEQDRKRIESGPGHFKRLGFSPAKLKYTGRLIFTKRERPLPKKRARRREMRKQALRGVTMLVSIIVLAFATAVVSNAQSGGKKLIANVPFDFVVGDKTLAAGEYSIRQITTNANGIWIRSNDGEHSAIRLTNPLTSSVPKRKTTLSFLRYGDTYYLSEVWVAGSSQGREMMKSKAERKAERELARNSSGSNLAQNLRPEVVTITAGVE